MAIRFEGKVAIVTGAGGGLGRAHALEFAARGAKVVVNDLGGAVDGTGGNSQAAEAVVSQIKGAGGTAIANGASVTDDAGVTHLVKQTMDAFGRIDVLIANAGILRDKSFGKMELKDFEAVMAVHLMGTVKPCKAVWQIMRDQQYGRIVVTTSSTGLYGNFGQTNYGAAKASLIGFMNSLKLEGARDNIKVNAICPVAGTRMTENIMPPNMLEMLKPEYVTPAVVYLASDDVPTGVILTAGAGVFAAARIEETEGVNLGHKATADDVAANFAEIADFSAAKHYFQGSEQSEKFFARLQDPPIIG
ncbi:MAG: SDR family NAD(P)-dependent oxidoreductase [Alphaproteobacteria bacterium]|nr:SDR family NAD(P)-dependent oxidoreductase [Alphaproteobacteria bacterium]MDE2631404.1 SDR family NAD(P)-dependent oxidoreductase [Alphaproteobacteria bacterium]